MTVVRLGTRPSASVLSLFLFLISSSLLQAQQSAPTADPPPASRAEFVKAADEVLQDMSEITGLTQVTPVKKTLRSRDEIRAYVIKQMDEDKNAD